MTSLTLVVGASVLAGGALRLYEAFAGEHPIFDAIYDVRLRREERRSTFEIAGEPSRPATPQAQSTGGR